ncbi:hypothetical protein ACO0R3_000287 [Hanseniaspora guilliermondii]
MAIKKNKKQETKSTTLKLPNITKKNDEIKLKEKANKIHKDTTLKHKLLTENETMKDQTSSQEFLLPTNYLVSLYGKNIEVHLKFNDSVYKGKLISIDDYFNIRLENTVEYVKDKETGKIGDCFIRCNTVLMITHKDS